MPFINIKTTEEIAKEKELALKAKLGKAIECFPGKTETWLMLNFEDNCKIYFQGKNDRPAAYLEVSILGSANNSAYDKMTAELTKIINDELDIPSDRIYIKYEETEHWGWNGGNF